MINQDPRKGIANLLTRYELLKFALEIKKPFDFVKDSEISCRFKENFN